MEYSKANFGSGREHGNRGKQKDLGEKRTILG